MSRLISKRDRIKAKEMSAKKVLEYNLKRMEQGNPEARKLSAKYKRKVMAATNEKEQMKKVMEARRKKAGTGCPQGQLQVRPVADNVGLWVNGKNELELAVSKRIYKYKAAIQQLNDSLNLFVQKERKGIMYWYQRDGRNWIYKGRDDPREAIKANIESLRKKARGIHDSMMAVVLKEFGEVIIIDLALFEQRVSKRIPSHIIRGSDIEAAQMKDNRLREAMLRIKYPGRKVR